ncbi:MAG TPA: hypothetical protein DCM68_03530 [Verrucomicrobia bacterium]|nr:hypothetical protein [Verrucomicrobiota bacterium]
MSQKTISNARQGGHCSRLWFCLAWSLACGLAGGATAADVLLPAQDGTVGNPRATEEQAGFSDEYPAHFAAVESFFMSAREITKAEWDAVRDWGWANGYDDLPSGSGGTAADPTHPVVDVSWHDAVKWCNARSEMDGIPPAYYLDDVFGAAYRTGEVDRIHVRWNGSGHRLPTEQEWELAARGGLAAQDYPWAGASVFYPENISPALAQFQADGTLPPGQFAANGYGLFDMSGNVAEWCWDWHDSDAYDVPSPYGPDEPAFSRMKVVRGGSWRSGPADLRVSARGMARPDQRQPHLGFRTAQGGYSFAIQSEHGTAAPAVSTYVLLEGAALTNSVASPETIGTTQYVCTGWTMVGNEPANGTTTQFVATLTNDAVLTWLWTTNYWLQSAAGTNGSVDVGEGWQPAGIPAQITATADLYYHFSHWSGDADSTANPLDLPMDGPKSVAANFAENWTVNKPTPEWWLANFGITNDFETAVLDDPDGDGADTGDEFVMDTDPTQSNSVLRISHMGLAYGTKYADVVWTNDVEPFEIVTQRIYEVVGHRIAWPCSTGRVYDVLFDTSMPPTEWLPMGGMTNLVPDSTTLAITNRLNEPGKRFYLLRARLP